MPVQVNVAADQQNLINSIERGVRAYNQRFSKSNTINLNINERGFTQPLGRITGAVNDFESAMAASNARVIAFGASTAVLGTAIAGFRSLAKASIEVEKNLADVNRILQLSTSDLQTFGKELFNISKRTATSFNDASKALLEFSRQGLSAEETLRRTNDALTLTRLAGLGAEASVAALTATVNGFAKSGITTTQVLNKLVAVEQAFAVSARDLSEGLSRTGQAAQEAGVNIDQLNALISAAQQRTARGGAVIGNALKTIFTRLQRSDTLDRLEEFNIAVRDVQGNTLPATTVLQNFAAAYNRLADAQRAQLSEQVAGVYQVNILKAIVSDLNSEQSIYNAALIKGASATNEASRANAQLNQTLSALLVQVGNNTQQLASTIGSVTFEPLAKSAAKAANSIVEAITDVITGEGLGSDLANGLLKGIRNVLAGPGAIAAFYTLFKLVQSSFTYVAQALPQIAGITTESQKRKNLEQAILGILQSESNISKSLLGNAGNQAQQAKILLGVAKQQTDQYREQLRLAGSLATTLRGQGVSAGARGLQTGRTRSGGYIPASTKMAERAGAFAGGYAPGKVINSPVGGVMNTAEDVKYMPGFAQPFINPPKNSKAGKLHRANAVRQVGVDPYMYGGFVPNFAKSQKAVNFQRGRSFEKVVGDLIGAKAAYNAPIDYKTVPRIPRGRGFNRSMYQPGVYADAHVGLGHTPAQIISKLLNHNEKYNNLEIREDGEDVLLVSDLVEIIGQGVDQPSITKKSRYGSLNATAKQNYPEYEGKMFRAFFDKDRVNIPNFAAGYRNPFTGALNNAAIARGLRTGALTEKQAQEMGYTTSSSKIGARKAKRAAAVGALNYQMVYVPWDIEGFRGGRSGGRLNIAQGTAYESFILSLLRSGQLKGTTSLGQSFSLPARPDVVSSAALKGGSNARIDGYSLSAGEMYEMKAGGTGNTASGLQDKFIKAIENNPEILNPKRKWKNYIFRTTAAKGRGASGGFIPNLAYKGEVMDLEEFISGQKAIYSETPFPHVRNESQPTFASAIADHGGLSNALKDSYRNQSAAGMVHGGYVPNFAFRLPSDDLPLKGGGRNLIEEKRQKLAQEIDKVINSYRKGKTTRDQLQKEVGNLTKQYKLSNNSEKKVQQAVERRVKAVDRNIASVNKNTQQNNKRGFLGTANKFLGQGSTALAIGGPLLAGIIEQSAFGGRQRSEMSSLERGGQSFLSTGLTSITAGASIAGLPGAVVGAGIALVSAFKAAELSAEELAEVNQKLAQENQESVSAASAYVNAQKKLNDLIRSGAANSEIEQASKAVRDSFYAIKDVNLQRSFTEAGSDVEKMTEKLSEFSTAFAKTQAVRNLGALGAFEGANTVTETNRAFDNLDRNLVRTSLLTSGIDLDKLQGLARQGGQRFLPYARDYNEGRAALMDTGRIKESRDKFAEDISDELTSMLTDVGLNERSDEFKAAYEFFVSFLFGPDAFGIIKDLAKDTDTFDISDRVAKFQAAASRSFNEIFRDLNAKFQTISSETLKTIESQSSDQRIKSTILDFTSSFTDQISSFVSGNLPDLEKLQFAQSAARQKANDQLIKLNQDYAAFEQNQNTERLQVLQKNAEELTSVFEKSLFKSQAVGQIFEEQILTQLQSGDYSFDLNKISQQASQKALQDYNTKFKAGIFGVEEGNPPTFDINAFSSDQRKKIFEEELKYIREAAAEVKSGEGADVTKGNLDQQLDRFAEREAALLSLQEEINLITTDAAKDELKLKLQSKANELELFDLKASNAKKEFELNKALSEQRIKAEEVLAVKKAEIDAQNLRRTQAAASASTRLGFSQDLSSATGESRIASIQRSLNDPRQTYGMGLQEITERRIAAERQILEERRAIEDNQLRIEMQQSMLRLNAEIQNTNALKQLNSTMLDFIGVQLSDDADVQAISEFRKQNAGSESLDSDVNSLFSAQAVGRYNALQRINAIQASSSSSSSGLSTAFSSGSDLSFESLKNTAKGNEELLEQINLLEEQYKVRKEIIDLQRADIDKDRKQQEELDRLNNTLRGRFEKGVGQMEQESQNILLNLAETAPSRFADGMANALSEVAQGTKSIGDAFADMAIDFGRMLQQEVFRALAQKAVGSLLGNFASGIGSQTGGVIRAQNGMYISGGRTGDRNLALLEDGEYVLNRNAVKSMGGPRALDRLNFGMAPRFQGGGGYSMEAARSLKNGEYDYTGDLMFNGANIGAINPDLYSAYAFENDAYFQRRRELARERFQRQIQKRFERRQKRAQLVGAIIGAAGSMFMSAGLGRMTSGPKLTGDTFGGGVSFQNINGQNITSPNFQASIFDPTKLAQKGGLIGYNSGGFVPHGSRLSDTIPAMLTGGEYVMNNSAVKKYGLGTMNSMNAGSYQSGGMASTTNNTNNNSTSISINVDRSGKAVYGASTNSYDKDDIVLSKEMARQINNLVLKSMVNEKRYGGELYKNPLRT